MPYTFLMFLHVGSMFLATSLAVGPVALFVLILRTGDVPLIRRSFRFAAPLSRFGGVFYGLGVIFGIGTALNGGIPLTSQWLLTAYVLLILLVGANLYADHWMKEVAEAAVVSESNDAGPVLASWVRSRRPVMSLAATAAITLAIVFVMVVKPDPFA
jgi:uncharacterized membrane protein